MVNQMSIAELESISRLRGIPQNLERRESYRFHRALGKYDLLVDCYSTIDEALQAVSTCEQLIAHSLNPVKEFRKIPSISKMYPIVVATEKFTTNPLTLCDIRKEVEDRKGGRNPRIAPVEVVNLEELETLLLLSKTYGLSIVNLLEKKAQGSFWSDSINNFLATFYRPQLVALSETKTNS